jgi:hypothetical protein
MVGWEPPMVGFPRTSDLSHLKDREGTRKAQSKRLRYKGKARGIETYPFSLRRVSTSRSSSAHRFCSSSGNQRQDAPDQFRSEER